MSVCVRERERETGKSVLGAHDDDSVCGYQIGVYCPWKPQFGFFVLMAYQPSWVISCQSHPSRRAAMLLFSWEDKGVYPQRYLFESEHNSATGVRTRLLRFRSPSLYPLHHEDTWKPLQMLIYVYTSMYCVCVCVSVSVCVCVCMRVCSRTCFIRLVFIPLQNSEYQFLHHCCLAIKLQSGC